MKNTVFYLCTCSTCKRIISNLNLKEGFELREIKSKQITAQELDQLKELAGNYEALFNKRSRQYTALQLKDKALSETDIRQYILDEYTFLKRPVTVYNNEIFIGNAKKTISELEEKLK